MTEPATAAAPVWKRVLAVILDFFTAFFVLGLPALVLFVLMAAYFFVGRRYLGGTLLDRILRIQRPQPKTQSAT